MTETGAFFADSLATYALPGMGPALLELQDRHALAVNLLLFAMWCAADRRELSQAQWRLAIGIVAPWSSSVTEKLRAARRACEGPREDVAQARKAILDAELQAERVEQNALERFALKLLEPAPPADARARARRNLAGYARAAGAGRSPGFSVALLDRIVVIRFGDDDPPIGGRSAA